MDSAIEQRIRVEDYLIHEAALLDEWRLEEWHKLFTEDCRYLVPNLTGDPYAPSNKTLYLIADDAHHLAERVKRLGKKTAHSEQPRSRTRRLISNVRILENKPRRLMAQCGFATYRASHGVTDVYFGRHEHLLIPDGDTWKIEEKRSILDMGALRPHGRLSIIV